MKRFELALVAVFCSALALPGLIVAQPPGGDRGGPGGPGGFFGGGGGGVVGLAMRDEVQQELQLVDEQQEKIRNIADEARDNMRDEFRDMFSQMRDLSDEERRERFGEIRTRMEALNAELDEKLKKVLLPHQYDRLKQIDVQQRVQRGGASALTRGDLAETLNLTDEQREKLEQRYEEVQAEVGEQIQQLQADARKKMLDVLTAEQRAKLEQLMGDQFNMPEQRFDFRGFGGRDGERDRGRDGRRRGDRSRNDGESI